MKVAMMPGTLVVFEGLDATGKSTQLKLISDACDAYDMITPKPLFTHQPSGGNAVGNAVYAVTENGDIQSPLARQLLHLASHAEHYERTIIPHLKAGGVVFLDRCWWSTVAYGYFGSSLRDEVSAFNFFRLARMPARETMPDAVMLFLDPHEEDRHNTPAVMEGYEHLRQKYAHTTYRVPTGSREQVTESIFAALKSFGLAEAVG